MCSKKVIGDDASPFLSTAGEESELVPSLDRYLLGAGNRWVKHGRKLLLASTVLSGAMALSQMPSVAAAECTDTDGDGFGWDGEKTCDPTESDESTDADQDQPVTVDDQTLDDQTLDDQTLDDPDEVVGRPAEPETTNLQVSKCVDTDGDGFGWNGVATCLLSERDGSSFAIVDSGYLDPSDSTVSAIGTERASDNAQTVNVSWGAIAGASGYNVFRDGHYIGSANRGRLSLIDVLSLDAVGNYSIRAFDEHGTYGEISPEFRSTFVPSTESSETSPEETPITETPGATDNSSQAEPCIDTDGDGFGWNGTATCIPLESPNDSSIDDQSDDQSDDQPVAQPGDGPCTQQLLVAGDSWAHYTYPTLEEVFTEQGWCVYRDSPDGSINFAEVGSVSHQFLPGERLNDGIIERLDEICKTACDDVSMVFSIGGNDHLAFPTNSEGQIEAAGELGARVATSIASFAGVAPGVKVTLPGYDILNVDNSPICRALPAFITGDIDASLNVTAAVPRSMATINDNLSASLPNTQHADLIGTLQGEPGNREITTLPARFLTADDCIHATADGNRVFAEELAMTIDPSLSLPGATVIDVNAPDPVAPDPVGPNARQGFGIQPTKDIPANPETYDSLTINYQVLNNIEMDDPNVSFFGVDLSDDEIELKVIEFGITPGEPDTAYARVLPRQGQISADEGDKVEIPDHVGLYGFSDLNPIGFEEFRESAALPDLIGHVVIAYENDDGGIGNDLEDAVVQRAADQLKTELVEIVGPIETPLDIAAAPQVLIDQVFEGTDRVNDAAKPQSWWNKRLAEGFGQLVDTNVIFYFVTDPATSDRLNPAFDQFRTIDTPAFGGAATNQSFVLDFARGTKPDPHYEVVVDVRLGTGLPTSAPRPVTDFSSDRSQADEVAFNRARQQPTQPDVNRQSLADERASNGQGSNSLTNYTEPQDNTSSAPGTPGSYENVGNSGLSGAAG